jgi:chemotaxis protein MotB
MAANPAGTEQPIIIKKKKGGHGAHHGGAWKVAYADFVTAMMAFFLLLWLLNVTTSDQRKGIADYFAPSSVSKETSGSGGVLGGQTITAPGAQISASTVMSADVPSSGQPGVSSTEVEDPDNPTEEAVPRTAAEPKAAGSGGDGGPGGDTDIKPSESRLKYQERLEAMAKQLGIAGQKPGETLGDFADRIQEAVEKLQGQQGEAKQFQQTANEIRQAIQSIPELAPLAQNLMIDQTPDGLRIQIVDQEKQSMFPGGSSQMYPQTRQLADLVAKALGKLPNKLSISGHTDSTPFAKSSGRDNWDLSTERANAMRRAMLQAGVAEDRIQDVTGRADRDLLDTKDPASARNRRISIVLLRETKKP